MDITIDSAYCISLKDRTDRRQTVVDEFKKLPCDVEFFDAINGKIAGIEPENPPQGCTKISKAELGCLLSHYAVIKRAKEKGSKWVLILEDDVVFQSQEAINTFLSCLPSNTDMFYFGANHREDYHSIDDKIAKCRFALTTHAVCIRENLFDTMLKILNRKNLPVDVLYALTHKIYNVYCSVKNIAYQKESFSDIAGKVTNYESLK